MKRTTMLGVGLLVLATCATAPHSASGKDRLLTSARGSLTQMQLRDPGLQSFLADSAGYAVFPDIGKAGLGVGGASGRGVLFRHGQAVGFVRLDQASVGWQVGAQTLAELIVFRDEAGVARLEGNTFELGASASAVLVTAGAAGTARFADGVAVFQYPRGGLMLEATVEGQRLRFSPGT